MRRLCNFIIRYVYVLTILLLTTLLIRYFTCICKRSISFTLKLTTRYCGINVVRWGLIFVDFVGHPYPRIYVSSNLYFINQTSKHRLLSFKTVFMNTGNTWRWHTKFLYFFWPSCENLGIIYFELFNCVNQHQSQTIFIK